MDIFSNSITNHIFGIRFIRKITFSRKYHPSRCCPRTIAAFRKADRPIVGMGLQGLAGGDAESYLIQVLPFPWAKGHLPILLKSVSFPQLLLHLGLLMCEIILPPRAEIDMPPPEPPDQRLRIPIIMCPQLAVLARVCFCLSHGFDVLIGLKIRKHSFSMTNRRII